MIGKLLYLYEGQEKKDGRKELKNVFYLGGLCSGVEANRHLFERMQEYIDTNYERRYLNAVYISGDGGAWIKAGAEYIEKGVPVLDKFHMMKYINKAANQMLDEAGEAKGRLWKALYKGKKKKFVKTIKAIRKCAPNEKAVNDCEEYLLNNWDSAVRRMQDKNVYGCSAEGHVSHMYSDRMSSRPMGWSEAGADAMCQLRCYVKDYGEEKILELVKYRRSHKQEEATGTEEISVRPNRGYMRSLLLHSHDNDRVIVLWEQLNKNINNDLKKQILIMILESIVNDEKSGLISQLAELTYYFLGKNRNYASRVFNTIIMLAEDEMNHQKFNAVYIKNHNDAEYEFIPNMVPKLRGVDYWIRENKGNEYQNKRSEIIQEYLYDGKGGDLSEFDISNYDIDLLCNIACCGLDTEDEEFAIVISSIVQCMIEIWHKNCKEMRAHEIIDTFQEHKVSSYFQRELNIIGRNPEAVYDILFKGTDFSIFTRDTLDFYEDVLSGFLAI